MWSFRPPHANFWTWFLTMMMMMMNDDLLTCWLAPQVKIEKLLTSFSSSSSLTGLCNGRARLLLLHSASGGIPEHQSSGHTGWHWDRSILQSRVPGRSAVPILHLSRARFYAVPVYLLPIVIAWGACSVQDDRRRVESETREAVEDGRSWRTERTVCSSILCIWDKLNTVNLIHFGMDGDKECRA